MNAIAQTEKALRDAINATLGNTLRRVDSLGGGWTLANLKRALQFSPGCYVTFQGATAGRVQDALDLRFSVYVVTKGATDPNRRQGNKRIIGAYDIINRLLPVLNGLPVPTIGELQSQGIDNLFREAMFDLGGTVYAIQLTLPNVLFTYQADANGLDDFLVFDATYDIAPDDPHNPTAEDQVHLPGPEDTTP